MHQLLKEIDKDNSGTLSCNEFESLTQRFDAQLRTAERYREIVEARRLGFQDAELFVLREAFFAMDTEGQGRLGMETLRTLVNRIQCRLGNQAIKEAFMEVSRDASGQISFVGFLHIAKALRICDEASKLASLVYMQT
eukprot:UN1089